jgi:ABC-type uncharacterized transport system auxiliary subunit
MSRAMNRLVSNKKGERRARIHAASFAKAATMLLAAIGAATVAGCGAARPMQYYQLSVPTDMPQAEPSTSSITLALGPLVTNHLYREDRIVYSSGAQQMGTYEYQRWTEPPAEMIHEVLLRELRASGRYREVSNQRSGGRADYVLRGQLYDFKEVSGSPLQARVTAEWELRDTKTGLVVWTHHYGHDEAVNGKDVPAMVAALDKNAQRAVSEVKAGLDQYFASAANK